MNFKNIIIENLDNMMNDLKNLKGSNVTTNASSINNQSLASNTTNKQSNLNIKVIFDKNKNEYQIVDMDGNVYASLKDKSKIPLIIDTLKSYV
jgi:predicted ribosome quality control (RQC) complex YloA/Tae2 family protein